MAPRSNEQNDLIRTERREQILQAALGVFARKGLMAAKIGDIAAAAGLSHGLVYHYFASKDEVFTALVDRALEGTIAVVQAALQQPGTPWEQLRWLTAAMVEGGRQRPEHGLIMVQAFTSEAVPPAVKQLVAEKGPQIYRYLVPLIQAGQAAGQVVAEDPIKLAVAHSSLVQGLILGQTQGQGTYPAPDVDMVLRLLKA
ncbi:MAG TPA: TetR/AcrR family transcriptional regulator [Symbiobacteriaceae bacterium]|nr:TetR/AcrR family transcriptional regulator [Symbiobacteriaceae bacterium]